MPKTVVQLEDGYRVRASSRDHSYFADEPVDAGGEDAGPTPTEMMLSALGSCMAITVKMYANRKGWPLQGVEIALELERFNGRDYAGYEDSQFVHEIRSTITFKGPLNEEQRARLLEISGKCPVHRVLEYPTIFKEELMRAEALSAD
jgi:putative redox protein